MRTSRHTVIFVHVISVVYTYIYIYAYIYVCVYVRENADGLAHDTYMYKTRNPVFRSGRFLRSLRIIRLVRLIRVAKPPGLVSMVPGLRLLIFQVQLRIWYGLLASSLYASGLCG